MIYSTKILDFVSVIFTDIFPIQKGAKVDRQMSDGTVPLMRAFDNQDMTNVNYILNADLEHNFLHRDGITAESASAYQSKQRGEKISLNLY